MGAMRGKNLSTKGQLNRSRTKNCPCLQAAKGEQPMGMAGGRADLQQQKGDMHEAEQHPQVIGMDSVLFPVWPL
eukprot:4076704-Amphidinium_carterae.1